MAPKNLLDWIIPYLCMLTDPLLDSTILLSHVSQSLLLLGILIVFLAGLLLLFPLLFFLEKNIVQDGQRPKQHLSYALYLSSL